MDYGLIVTGIALVALAVLSGIGARLAAAFWLLKDAILEARIAPGCGNFRRPHEFSTSGGPASIPLQMATTN
jgi:hypothetical protein